MWKRKLCLNLLSETIPVKEQLLLFKKTGFEGFFAAWKRGVNLKEIRDLADSVGMYFQSVHAPFGKAADMWRGGERARLAQKELLECLDAIAEAG